MPTTPPLPAGTLRHRLALQAPTAPSQDTFGGPTSTWTTLALRWGEVTDAAGRKQWIADQSQSLMTHVVTMRKYPGLSTAMRLVKAGYPSTTVAGAIAAPGSHTVTPASMTNIRVGSVLVIDTGTAREIVTVTAVTGTTFTATFAMTHGAGFAMWVGRVLQISQVLIADEIPWQLVLGCTEVVA